MPKSLFDHKLMQLSRVHLYLINSQRIPSTYTYRAIYLINPPHIPTQPTLINPLHIPTQPTSHLFPHIPTQLSSYNSQHIPTQQYISLILHIYLHSLHLIYPPHIPTQPTSHESLTFTFTVCISLNRF